jgi:hypothetical protein
MDAEERYRLEPPDVRTPEKLFDRRWAISLLDSVMVRLEKEFVAAGKGTLFEQLRAFIVVGGEGQSYAQVARQLGMTEEPSRRPYSGCGVATGKWFVRRLPTRSPRPAKSKMSCATSCPCLARKRRATTVESCAAIPPTFSSLRTPDAVEVPWPHWVAAPANPARRRSAGDPPVRFPALCGRFEVAPARECRTLYGYPSKYPVVDARLQSGWPPSRLGWPVVRWEGRASVRTPSWSLNIARLNVDGSLDTSFNPGVSVSPDAREPEWLVVKCLARQPDGKILVGGRFNSLAGQLRLPMEPELMLSPFRHRT